MRSPGGLVFCLVPGPGGERPPCQRSWPDGRTSQVDQVCLDIPSEPVRRRARVLARTDRLGSVATRTGLGVRPPHFRAPGSRSSCCCSGSTTSRTKVERGPRLVRLRPRGRGGRSPGRRRRGAGPLPPVDRAVRPRRPHLLRHPPPTGRPTGVNDEIGNLTRFLDNHREMFRRKAGGLGRDQLQQTLPPSDLTLGGMVKHLAFVEDWWFGRHLLRRPGRAVGGGRLGRRPGLGLALRPRKHPRTALGASGGHGRQLPGRGGG